MASMGNPTGRHRAKRRHHGEGTVVKRTDRWRAKPWAAVVPYTDESGRRREMWLSAASKAEADELRKAELVDGCGFTLDPAAVRTALDACFAIMERPDSPANLMRGTLLVTVLALVVLGLFAGFRRFA